MRTLSFVLWLLLWWPLIEIGNYLHYLRGDEFTEEVKGAAAIANFIVWVVIGVLLYRKIGE